MATNQVSNAVTNVVRGQGSAGSPGASSFGAGGSALYRPFAFESLSPFMSAIPVVGPVYGSMSRGYDAVATRLSNAIMDRTPWASAPRSPALPPPMATAEPIAPPPSADVQKTVVAPVEEEAPIASSLYAPARTPEALRQIGIKLGPQELAAYSSERRHISSKIDQLDRWLEDPKNSADPSSAMYLVMQNRRDDAVARLDDNELRLDSRLKEFKSEKSAAYESLSSAESLRSLSDLDGIAEGTLWKGTASGYVLSVDEQTRLSEALNAYTVRYNAAKRAYSENDFETANLAANSAASLLREYKQIKSEIGGERARGSWFGYYTKDGRRISDGTAFAAWAGVLVPLITTGITAAITISENKAQRDWLEEENEKEREARLEGYRIQGGYSVAAAGAASGGGSKPVRASSGTLGGSFASA